MKLVYYENNQKKEYTIPADTFVIGRHASCELAIRDLAISRRHVQCTPCGDELEIRDLGSRNGLLINGKKISPEETARARDGDQIGLGKFKLVFFAGEASATLPMLEDEPGTVVDESFGEQEQAGAKTGPIAVPLEKLPEDRPEKLAPARLELITGGGKATYKLENVRCSLGTGADNDIVLVGDGISRHNTEICYGSNGWGISDLGSRNGTYVNRVRVSTAILNHNDIINIGPVSLRFVDESQQFFSPAPEPSSNNHLHLAIISAVSVVLILLAIAIWLHKPNGQEAQPAIKISCKERYKLLLARGIHQYSRGHFNTAQDFFRRAIDYKPHDKEAPLLIQIAEVQSSLRQRRSERKIKELIKLFEKLNDSEYPKVAVLAKEQAKALKRELADRRIISEAHDAFQKRLWKQAWDKYKVLSEKSIYYKRYKSEIQESKKNYEEQLIKEAQDLAEHGKMSAAIKKLEEAQQISLNFNQKIFNLQDRYRKNLDYERIMLQAREAMQTERYDDALRIVEVIPEGTLFYGEAQKLRIVANRALVRKKVEHLFRNGQGTQAIVVLEREQDPSLEKLKKMIEKVVTLYDEACKAMKDKDYKEANKRWASIITLVDDHDNFYRQEAEKNQKINPKDEAIRHVQAGERQLKAKNYREATRSFKDALKIDPENSKAIEGLQYLRQQAAMRYNMIINRIRNKAKMRRALEEMLEWVDPLWPTYTTIQRKLEKLR